MDMNLFLNFFGNWGLSGIVIAAAAFGLTYAIKYPLKKWAKKKYGEDKTKVTKFFVFIPILLCFVGSVIDTWIRGGISGFDAGFDWLRVMQETLATMGVPSLIVAFVENFGGDWKNSFRKELEESRKNAEDDTHD